MKQVETEEESTGMRREDERLGRGKRSEEASSWMNEGNRKGLEEKK